MIRKWMTALSAGCLVVALSIPAFAQEPAATQTAAKTEHKAMTKSSGSSWAKSVQEALKAKGNDPGPIDGRMGHKTTAAIKAFQEANSLKATGKIDKDTAEKLGVEMPKTTHHSSKSTAKKPASSTKQ